jgi:hypothetical protein
MVVLLKLQPSAYVVKAVDGARGGGFKSEPTTSQIVNAFPHKIPIMAP